MNDAVNILLVDDQPAKLLTYQTILEGLGENLIQAHSATEALDHFLRTDIAVVLIDVCMPDLDGFELAAMLRDHPRFKRTAIIFVSAVNLSDLDRLRGYESGAVDYVPVPVVPEILRAKVTILAELHRKTRQLEQLNRELELRVAARTAELEASTASLQKSEERFKLALECAGMATWDTDPRTGSAVWSSGFFDMLGYAPIPGGVVNQQLWLDRLHPEDRYGALEATERARRDRSVCRSEHRVCRADNGRVLWLATLGRFFYDEEGQAIRYVGVAMDVTERRRMEDALRESDRRKDEFIATLAHELRNPLAPIAAALHVMGSEGLPEDRQAQAREVIGRQLQTMVRLIDDLLDISRITTGKIALQKEVVDVGEIVSRAVESCRPSFLARRLQLTVEGAEAPLDVEGDTIRLVQVLSNILNNAAKFSDEGGAVGVAVAREGGEAVIRVKDRGVGVRPEMLPKVFDLFTQIEPAHGRTHGGLGIGLALVRRLVGLHGGSVSAHSEGLGHGTELVVRLPCRPRRSHASERRPSDPSRATSARRVVVADDNTDALLMLAMALEMEGNEVHTADDGIGAVQLAATLAPDVVILDIGMPGLDGYATAREIRSTPAGKGIYLIALTGWAQPQDQERSREAGFDLHLRKPVDFATLAAALAGAPRPRRAAELSRPEA